MARCGEKYADLIRSASGKAPDNRCTLYCNEADVIDWQDGTRTMRRRVLERGAALSVPASLAAELGQWADRVDAMAAPEWYPGGWGSQIGHAIGLQGDGACLLERLEELAAAQGQAFPVPSSPTSSSGAGLGGILDGAGKSLLTLAAVGGGIYLLSQD